MAMPTKEKTWLFDVNVSRTGPTAAMVGFKDSMKAFSSNPWTVWGSSQGTNFGNNDGNDRWGTPVINNWIVLKQPAIATNFQLCIQYTSSINLEWATTLSFAGFNTNGTATSRPTASDEFTYTTTQDQLRPYPNGAAISHIMQSSDGLCLRWMRCASSKAVCIHFLERVKNPVSGLTGAVIAGRLASGTSAEIYTYANWNDNAQVYLTQGTSGSGVYMTSEGWNASTLGEQITFPDDDTAEYPLSNIHLACATLGARGARKGSLYDLWWGSTAAATGDTYPGDGSAAFAQFGHLIFPWNGTTPLIA